MSDKRFIGAAPAVAQVDDITPANVEATDIFTVLLSNHAGDEHTISFVASAGTVQNVVEGLKALAVAAAAAGIAPWDEVTATEDDTKLILTADVAGRPFWATPGETDGGGVDDQTHIRSVGTAVAGPGIFDTAENYEGGVAPVATDTIIVSAALTGTLYGGDFDGTQYTDLDIEPGCTAAIGSRTHPLELDLSGVARLSGTGVTWLDIENAADIYVREAGSSAGAGEWDLNLLTLDVTALHIKPASSGAKIALAPYGDQTSEIDTVYVLDGDVRIGEGVTNTDGSSDITAVYCSGGSLDLRSDTDLLVNDGEGCELTYRGGDVENVKTYAGMTDWDSAGGISTKLYVGGEIRFDSNMEDKTIAACEAYDGAIIGDPLGVVTWTTGIKTAGCRPDDITLERPTDGTITPS